MEIIIIFAVNIIKNINMTKFHYKLILFAAFLLTHCTGKKVIPDAVSYSVTVTKISKANDPKTGYDTVWFEVSPASKNVVVDVNSNEYNYANPVVIKRTSNYLVLDRSNYNGGNQLQLVTLAYGKAFFSESVNYDNFNSIGSGGSFGGLLSGKILFRTADKWVLWDLTKNKVLYSSTNTNLDIVDYNPNLGYYLVRNGNYMYYYSEDFIVLSVIYAGSSFYYSDEITFAGINKAVSYCDPNFYSYAYNVDNFGTINYVNNFSFYSCHHIYTSSNLISNRLFSYIYNGFYYLELNGSRVKYNSAYPYKNLEISNSAQYLTYTLNGYLNLYTTGNNTSMQLSYIGSGNRGCFNSNSTQLTYIYNNRLNVYDIKSSSSSDPLYGTSFSNVNIYEAYW